MQKTAVNQGHGWKFYLAVALGWIVEMLETWIRILGRGGPLQRGTSLPGYLALRCYPRLLEELLAIYDQVVVVTGTNGKTTTTNLLAEMARATFPDAVVTINREGANMLAGLVTALMRDRKRAPAGPPGSVGHKAGRVAVLEVDEGTLPALALRVHRVDAVVITNLFRDQLDRYAEVAILAEKMRLALGTWPGARLILNADDPAVARMGEGRKGVAFYGLEGMGVEVGAEVGSRTQALGENLLCPHCHARLDYSRVWYSHLGDYRCRNCGFSRPRPQYRAEIQGSWQAGGTKLVIEASGQKLEFCSPLSGRYNAYNLLAAASALGELAGVDRLYEVSPVASAFKPREGRDEWFSWPGLPRRARLALVKNPVGLTETLQSVLSSGVRAEARMLVLAINDLAADGRDVSWLYDADWSALVGSGIEPVICSGLRAYDMAVCLKYQGLDPSRVKVLPSLDGAVSAFLDSQQLELDLLCTYTCLAPGRRALLRRGARPGLPQAEMDGGGGFGHGNSHCPSLPRVLKPIRR